MIGRMLRLTFVVGLAGAGMVAAQPVSAFFGSFQQSCRGINVYDGGYQMTAYCRTLDGGWRYSHIYSCGGAGVHNDNGFLACGT